MAREKALKRGNWFKGGKEKEEWKNLTKTSNRRMNKKKFRKAGDRKYQGWPACEKAEIKIRGNGSPNWL